MTGDDYIASMYTYLLILHIFSCPYLGKFFDTNCGSGSKSVFQCLLEMQQSRLRRFVDAPIGLQVGQFVIPGLVVNRNDPPKNPAIHEVYSPGYISHRLGPPQLYRTIHKIIFWIGLSNEHPKIIGA